MHHSLLVLRWLILILVSLISFSGYSQTTNINLRVMSANLNGNIQNYQPFALRIFQGLKPDVVAIQEFNYDSTNGLGNNTPAAFREMLDTAFGTNYTYMRETGSYNIPNGVISRYPIVASGQWDDSLVSDRGFAWAQIHLPGTNDLYVVSVHLYSSGTATDRNTEATTIKTQIQNNFPANAWVIVAGDFNTDSRSEAAISTFKMFLSDNPIPTDAEAGGDADTNEPRSKPYDYVLPSFAMTNALTNVVFASHSFSNGLVFDSSIYTPLNDVAPVQQTDSHMAQHMAVLKDFRITYAISNSSAPSIATGPQSQTVPPGSNVTFTVSATGAAPLNYLWRFNGTNIASATTTSYTRTNAQLSDAGNYTVLVTNTSGSVTSSIATLIVGIAPTISSQPAGTNVNPGASATFTVLASGTPPPVYQWRLNGTNIAGASDSSYTRSNVQAADTGNYSVLLTNFAGSLVSSNALLSVNSAPSITAQPQSLTVSSGQDASFTVTATGTAPLSYQWRFAGTNISGANATSYTRAAAQLADAGSYTVVVTNALGSLTSSVATLTVVSSQPVVIAQWNFNSASSDTNANTGTLNPATGSGTASYVNGTAPAGSGEFASGSSTDGNTTDNSGWNTSTYPVATVSNKTAGVKFTVSTTNRQNIIIRWDQRASSTGSKYSRLQYTTNGTTFLDFQTPTILSSTSFEVKTNNLTGLPGVDNNPNFAFRIVAEFESTAITNANAQYVGASGTYASSGTVRFDMVTITGTPLAPSVPASPATLSSAVIADNLFHFTLTGTAGSNYIIQAATSLSAQDWTNLATNQSPFSFTNSATLPTRLYRALVQ